MGFTVAKQDRKRWGLPVEREYTTKKLCNCPRYFARVLQLKDFGTGILKQSLRKLTEAVISILPSDHQRMETLCLSFHAVLHSSVRDGLKGKVGAFTCYNDQGFSTCVLQPPHQQCRCGCSARHHTVSLTRAGVTVTE